METMQKFNPKITIDGDDYMVSLPTMRMILWMRTYLQQMPCLDNKSWHIPCITTSKSEMEESSYLFIGVPGENLLATRRDFLSAKNRIDSEWRYKQVGDAYWGFRPCLIPLDKYGCMRKLSPKENPNGSVVDGGTCLVDNHMVDVTGPTYSLIDIQAKISFQDSLVGQRNLTWFVVDGLLICANILFASPFDFFVDKRLLLSSADEFLFRDFLLPQPTI